MRVIVCAAFFLAIFGEVSKSNGQELNPTDIAAQAAKVLERNCLRCHRGAGSISKARFDVRRSQTMIDEGVVQAGDPESSLLWQMAHRGTMPPRSLPQLARPTGEDSQILAEWIRVGAPAFPSVQPRDFISLKSSLEAISTDLRKIRDERARDRLRYFSLLEMYNNPHMTNETLNLARAALSKAINSLSWEREIVVPRAVDAEQTVFAVDITQLGWTRAHWLAIRASYPYAIGFNNLDDRTLRDIDEEIANLAKNDEPLYRIRADWFIATALQPALYHELLYDLALPELKKRLSDSNQPANPKQMTAADLERFLDVDLVADILRGEDRAMRCGFTSSGVSGQNRLIERHKTRYGAYWKSYDFKAENRRAILSQFPLGPVFPGHEFPQLAFEHDGGEIIFNLPNGLQAYLLVDGKDRRIDAGPVEVVSDALKTSGTPAIVNGLSCMSCHKEGMIDSPPDEIREFARVFGPARDQVNRLYPLQKEFQAKVEEDAGRFQSALNLATGPILQQGSDANRDVTDFSEPISEVSRNYLLDELDLQAAAAELYEPSVNRLRQQIESDELLKRLGLGVLLRPDGTIKRAFWEGSQGGRSVMQLTAFELKYTTSQFSR